MCFPSESIAIPVIMPLVGAFTPVENSLTSLSVAMPLAMYIYTCGTIAGAPGEGIEGGMGVHLVELSFRIHSWLSFYFRVGW